MSRVRLEIQRHEHEVSRQANLSLTAVRVFADVALAGTSGSDPRFRAIVDTGAPVTLLPKRMWRNAAHVALGRVRVGGISKREECRIPAMLAELDCSLLDGATRIGPLRFHAFLADSDNVPALLGMSGLLEKFRIVVDVTGNEAYLEMR